jgi:HlyD family secretion protein
MIRDTAGQDRPLTQQAHPRRRWLQRGALAALALVALGQVTRGWLGAERSIDGSRLRLATVTRAALVRDIVADGRVVAASSPTLYAVAAGTVDLLVRPGDQVQRGQTLAMITSPELHSRLVQEQATLAGLSAEVERGGLELEHGAVNGQRLIAQAEIDRQSAARDAEMNREVLAAGVIPKLEMQRSEDALKKAEIALTHARAEATLQRKELTFDVGTRKQALDRQRAVVRELERQVAALTLTSPVDGQVSLLLVAQRATVAANAPVLTVVDLGAFELELRVPDSFARDLALGMAAEVRAGATTHAGRIRSVAPEVVDGSVTTRLELVAPLPLGLRQNQRLGARILIESRAAVLQVERGPFLELGGGTSAYVVRDGVAERRRIRVGAISLDAVEILSGAGQGDHIVVSGADIFRDALRVRIAN